MPDGYINFLLSGGHEDDYDGGGRWLRKPIGSDNRHYCRYNLANKSIKSHLVSLLIPFNIIAKAFPCFNPLNLLQLNPFYFSTSQKHMSFLSQVC